MERFKVLLIAFVAIFFLGKASAQQYTPMTAAGYQMKRIKADSTLHIPSFCGVPTLRNSTAKDGAIAMDTCNNKLYKWTNQAGWSEITGGGTTIDTTSLSNRINLKLNISDTASMMSPYSRTNVVNAALANKLNISDTASMLSPYLRKIDTTNKWVSSVTKVNDSTIRVIKDGTTSDLLIRGSGVSSTITGRFGNDTATVVMAKVHNNAGVQLTNGNVVTWSTSGTNSDAPSVRLANSKADSTSANTVGFVTGTIPVNDTGWVVLSGKIEKLNTSAFSNGDIIYLDTISGGWTKSKPSGPIHLVYLGVVVKANAGNGSIFVKCQNGYELDEIHDVKINTPLNNQVLAYSDTLKLWKNRDIYSIVDTTSLSNRINLKANLSQGTYSFLTNNTNATANMASTPFRDAGSQTYSGTITWNQTSPPSGSTNHSYRWSQIGKMVTLQISLVYGTAAGANQTTVQMALPTDCPTPITPSGMSATNLDVLYFGNGNLYSTINTIPTIGGFVVLRGTAAGGYEVVCTRATSAALVRYVNVTIQYFTNTTY